MQALSKEFIDQCPVEQGFRQRGLDMTRIEVFVDAAFAFAVTLLVISFDQIPRNFAEMVVAIKGIPAFVVAVAQIVWIWHEHNVWSRRFGLDDSRTVLLSAALVTIVLIYIFPLRVMAQGMFHWMSLEYLPSAFELGAWEELRYMFAFMGIGFAALCLVFKFLYAHAGRRSDELRLSGSERFQAHTLELIWLGCACIGLSSVLLALVLPNQAVPFSGFAYGAMGFWIPWFSARRGRYQQQHFPAPH